MIRIVAQPKCKDTNFNVNGGPIMKKTDILNALGFLLAITSCGTASQYASNQQYQDGFYSRPSVAETKTATWLQVLLPTV